MTKILPHSTDSSTWESRGVQYEMKDHVAWIRLHRPEKRNAIDTGMRGAVLEASAWEQTMWQTFREEVNLLGIQPGPIGGVRPGEEPAPE